MGLIRQVFLELLTLAAAAVEVVRRYPKEAEAQASLLFVTQTLLSWPLQLQVHRQQPRRADSESTHSTHQERLPSNGTLRRT